PRAVRRIDECARDVTTAAIATEQLETRVARSPVLQAACAEAAPLAPFEPYAGRIAREDLRASSLHNRQAVRDPSPALDHADRAPVLERSCRQTPSDSTARGELNAVDPTAVHDAHRRSTAAAAAARGDGKENEADETDRPQPVQPIRLTPLNADWLRYVSSK